MWYIIVSWVIIVLFCAEHLDFERYLVDPKLYETKYIWKLIINCIILSPLLILIGIFYVLDKYRIIRL